MNGLLVAGVVIPVEGVDVSNPVNSTWAKLSPDDYKRRKTSWVRAVVMHTTKGIHPQHVKPGKGPGGKDKLLADFYRGDKDHNGAHLVADNDGTAACLVDLSTAAAYHATTANDWTVGIEIYQEADGGIYEAAIATAVRLARAVCDAFDIPFQIHSGVYRAGRIVERLRDGGKDCVGIYGHRDQAWRFPWQLAPEQRKKYPDGYAARGRGDPGDHIMLELARAGADCFDFDRDEDLTAWQRRQRKLNALGAKLTVDGVAGPSTMDALRRLGFASGRDLDAA